MLFRDLAEGQSLFIGNLEPLIKVSVEIPVVRIFLRIHGLVLELFHKIVSCMLRNLFDLSVRGCNLFCLSAIFRRKRNILDGRNTTSDNLERI